MVSRAAAGAARGTPAGVFVNASSAVGSVACAIRVAGAGTLVVDFGVEIAGWVEFDSPDLAPADARALSLGIGEYTAVDYVGGFKDGIAYGAGRYVTSTGLVDEGTFSEWSALHGYGSSTVDAVTRIGTWRRRDARILRHL
jgi:hypothetical protein